VRERKTHDYRIRGWGHDYVIHKINGLTLDMSGWGYNIEVGDYLILEQGITGTRYEVTKIEYKHSDMWFAEAIFAPREITDDSSDTKEDTQSTQ
jgi:hypothetical protein